MQGITRQRLGQCGLNAAIWLLWYVSLRAVTYADDAPPSASPVSLDQRRLEFVAGSTAKVGQLTGDIDRQTGQPTLSRTESRAGVAGTDLGSSFEHRGKLVFLFGDTWSAADAPGNKDALAWTNSDDPHRLDLEFPTGDDGRWRPLTVPGVNSGAFEIPSHGFSVDGRMYVLFATDWSPKRKTMRRSVLAASQDEGRTFRSVYEFSVGKFINAAFWPSGEWIYAFGSGHYRQSSVCLARIPRRQVETREALEYLVSVANDGRPQWATRETEATPLFQHDVVGELSVAWCEPVKRYIMLYNSSQPRGIVLRSALQPWGPWSEPKVIFDPWKDGGYGNFMHISHEFKPDADELHDDGRRHEWGGEYGPFLMARYTSGSSAQCRIFFTMSTWNPYQVVIMRSDLKIAER
jgi:hypothetical protein